MPLIVLPSDYRDKIAVARRKSGFFDLTISDSEDLMVVTGWGYTSATHGNVHITGYAKEFAGRHFLHSTKSGNGFWYRVDVDLHHNWIAMAARDACVPADVLRRKVTGWFEAGGGDMITPILTFTDVEGQISVLAWEVRHGMAVPARVDIVEHDRDRLASLDGHWPTEDLAHAKIVVAGAGSIGSAACDALVAYGARRLRLVDPDHLYWHNFARHTTDISQAGRFKVHAVKQRLLDHDQHADIDTSTANVIADADVIREHLLDAAAMLVCVDGVEPRRVVNHLAYRAGVPAIFACVLANGRVGEALRILPGRHGCLLCHRRALVDAGVIDPEPSLDLGYGTGSRHLPMTAVGGDLAFVGQVAAKATVATLLERAGHLDQRLPGEHAAIGLRPAGDLPPPFDVGVAEVRWTDPWPSRADCPTCATNR
ncbi:MAG: ThiF family adenylyltransferase [Solirubrobacteraceae bacterium]